ncbi:uncharacterized protein METZ01_LOCUS272785, partial [marine metagenome]
SQAQEALIGKPLDENNIAEAAQLAADAAQPVGDHRGSEEFKRAIVKTMTTRAIDKAKTRAEGKK